MRDTGGGPPTLMLQSKQVATVWVVESVHKHVSVTQPYYNEDISFAEELLKCSMHIRRMQ